MLCLCNFGGKYCFTDVDQFQRHLQTRHISFAKKKIFLAVRKRRLLLKNNVRVEVKTIFKLILCFCFYEEIGTNSAIIVCDLQVTVIGVKITTNYGDLLHSLFLAVPDARKLKKHSFKQQKSSWRQQYTCELIYKMQNCSCWVNLQT